jgi:hypothetical protein
MFSHQLNSKLRTVMFNEWQKLEEKGVAPEYAMPTLLGVAIDTLKEAGYSITPPPADIGERLVLPIASIKGHHAQLVAGINNAEEGQMGLSVDHARGLAAVLDQVLQFARQP